MEVNKKQITTTKCLKLRFGLGGFRGGAAPVFSCSCWLLLFTPARMAVLIKVALGVSPCEGLKERCLLWTHVAGRSSSVGLFSGSSVHFV